MASPSATPVPAAVHASVVFFAVSGVLELALLPLEAARPVGIGEAWEALGRALLHWLVAAGLRGRYAVCRSLALVYCLAALVTYAVVLGLALAGAPLRFPPSVVVQSLVQVPSCALLLPFLRSARAARLFSRPLLGP